MYALAVLVCEHLYLYVARAFGVTLDVDVAVLKCRRRFRRRRLKRLSKLILLTHDAHAASAATSRRLDDHREAYLARQCERLFFRLKWVGAAGQDRQSS